MPMPSPHGPGQLEFSRISYSKTKKFSLIVLAGSLEAFLYQTKKGQKSGGNVSLRWKTQNIMFGLIKIKLLLVKLFYLCTLSRIDVLTLLSIKYQQSLTM